MTKISSQLVHFKNAQGITLAAKLDLPETEPRYFVIFSPCFTCTKETLATFRISQQLAKQGIGVLRLDFTGLGESEGDFGDSNFSTMLTDIIAANSYLAEHYKPASMLIGHSMGGTASYAVAEQLENVKAVASIASPSTPSHVLHHFGDALEEIRAGNVSAFYVAGKPYPIKPQFLENLAEHNLAINLQEINRAILILHGDNDELVNIEHAEKIYAAAKQPKSLVSLDTADHILSNRNDNLYVARLIDSWAERYISK